MAVLHPAAAPVVADDDVELPIRSEFQHAAVVVAAKRLPGVGLKRVQPDEISIQGEGRSIPDESVDAIAEQ